MITDATSAATTTSAAAAMKKATGMNKDDFLKLFVTQLQNQDPLNPQDGTQFISQLAQLTQVEQAYNTNTNLQSLLSQGSNAGTLAAVSLIGKQVEAPGSQVELTPGSGAAINYNLGRNAETVTVSVLDANGKVVKTITGGTQSSGNNSVTWDGTDNSGAPLTPGAYSFSVSAKDASGTAISTTGLVRGKVNGVDMSGSTPVLSVGALKLNLTDVTSVTEGV
ncbi:flagellar hook assembly protein FlgD [Geomonas subterranea]|uniref:Basal-body rod modification protein FlgD n=1 Tax=Geomonas subterranea TaxID=2847989 RepID=A0ABX8LH77_9BACT|nr:flagellar hook capping FlgD N-terminal domain-containing protein [Geomonas subterranea]QXE90271.1 flagellar hook assembly protein FlgD [Geomonas subterranea]QXM07604.1 flagellar hook assembly protein FlgD [Geomonas subterranea]